MRKKFNSTFYFRLPENLGALTSHKNSQIKPAVKFSIKNIAKGRKMKFPYAICHRSHSLTLVEL